MELTGTNHSRRGSRDRETLRRIADEFFVIFHCVSIRFGFVEAGRDEVNCEEQEIRFELVEL